MKKVLLILFIAVIPVLAQNVTVVEDITLTSQNEGSFYYPTLNPDGTGILFSSENHQGLWYKNLSSGKTVKISNAIGAGYEPGFSIGNNEIIYREDIFVKGKRFDELKQYGRSLRGGVKELGEIARRVSRKPGAVRKFRKIYSPSFTVNISDFQIAKNWKVGETYTIKVKQTGLSNKTASFKIVGAED